MTITVTGGETVTSITPSYKQHVTPSVVKTVGSVGTAQVQYATDKLSGALTAATYAELLSVETPGWLRLAGVYTIDSTSRTIGLKIVIDGFTDWALSAPVDVGSEKSAFLPILVQQSVNTTAPLTVSFWDKLSMPGTYTTPFALHVAKENELNLSTYGGLA